MVMWFCELLENFVFTRILILKGMFPCCESRTWIMACLCALWNESVYCCLGPCFIDVCRL